MTEFAAPPTEKVGLALFLDDQRRAILSKLDGLTDEQASNQSTVSADRSTAPPGFSGSVGELPR